MVSSMSKFEQMNVSKPLFLETANLGNYFQVNARSYESDPK